MTEEEWLACEDPWQLIPFAAARTARKLLLFEVACCRRVWHLMDDARHRNVVEAAERLCDGHLTEAEFEETMRPIIGLWRDLPPASVSPWEPYHFLTGATRHLGSTGVDAASYSARAVTCAAHPKVGVGRSVEPNSEEVQAQVNLLRDIFGNPFRPVSFSAEWRTSDVLLLAQGIYTERAFDRMPILADALQDAGCDNTDILTHLRDADATHVRGCWALDLVLGKE
jgi:hypothetical protein